MVGTLNATVTGHATVSGQTVTFALSFTVTVADAATAQTVLNGIKTFLTGGGATLDAVTGTFTPQATSLA